MSDLISRADAIGAVQTYLNILINSRRHGDDFTFINVLTEIRNKISALPSADAVSREDTVTLNSPISIQTDMVSVVRCKDCRFSEIFQKDSSGVMAIYCRAFTFKPMVSEDDYCSYGERIRRMLEKFESEVEE